MKNFPAMSDFAVVAAWRDWLLAQGLSTATARLYTYGVFRLLTEHVRGGIADATEAHIVAFLAELGDKSPAKRKYLEGIRSCFRYCVRRGHAESDPTEDVRIRGPRRRRRRQPVLSPEELFRVFCAAWEREPRRAWALALDVGMGTRRMELVGIRPQDIQGDEVDLLHCKGGKTRRVPIGDLARVALDQLRPSWNGTILGGIGAQTLTDWFKQAARAAGVYEKVRGRSTHIYRATFATYLIREGVPITVVRDLLGHESIATTNVYGETDPEDLDDGVQRLRAPSRARADSGRISP